MTGTGKPYGLSPEAVRKMIDVPDSVTDEELSDTLRLIVTGHLFTAEYARLGRAWASVAQAAVRHTERRRQGPKRGTLASVAELVDAVRWMIVDDSERRSFLADPRAYIDQHDLMQRLPGAERTALDDDVARRAIEIITNNREATP